MKYTIDGIVVTRVYWEIYYWWNSGDKSILNYFKFDDGDVLTFFEGLKHLL